MDFADRVYRLAELRSAGGFPRGFRDRAHAGQALAQQLAAYQGRRDVIVLALPRGGVPVAYEIARALGAPLDVLVVKKIVMPEYEEMAVGATASDGDTVLDEDLIERLHLSKAEVYGIAEVARAEVVRRERTYRNLRSSVDVSGRTVILVDDGLATGSSMRAAIVALRRRGPARIVVAVPVASVDAVAELQTLADDVVCTATPEPFYAVGLWYDDFAQTSDEQVRELLERAASRESGVW
jgi:predicted phosphoribosyltransferase